MKLETNLSFQYPLPDEYFNEIEQLKWDGTLGFDLYKDLDIYSRAPYCFFQYSILLNEVPLSHFAVIISQDEAIAIIKIIEWMSKEKEDTENNSSKVIDSIYGWVSAEAEFINLKKRHVSFSFADFKDYVVLKDKLKAFTDPVHT